MSPPLFQNARQHLVSGKKFSSSIARVLDRTYACLGRKNNNSLPLIIGVEVDYRGREETLPSIRSFFNNLGSLREKHFVRFLTDSVWACESSSGHQFYTFDGTKDSRCDAVWTISVIGPDQVDVNVHFPKNPQRTELLSDVTRSLKRFVHGQTNGFEADKLHDLTVKHFHDTRRLYQVTHLDDPCHVLMIPTLSGKGYYSVPLLGMNLFDAKRQYRSITTQIAWQQHQHYEIFNRSIIKKDILHTLVSLVQDTQHVGCVRLKEAYETAELLYAMWAEESTFAQSKNDMILFHLTYHKDKNVHILQHSMNNM